jgi:hypothetical protein
VFCSKCGKEIRGDSVFCYFCGSKVEENEKQDTVTNTPPVVVNKETQVEANDIKQTISEKKYEPVVALTDKTPLPHKNKRGWGWLILVCFYVSFILKPTDTHTLTSLTVFSIKTIGLIITIVFFFWLKKFLPNKGLFKIKFTPGSNATSFVSGVISFYLIGMLVFGTVGYWEGLQKDKEVKEFMNNYKGQIEMVMKQEIEYSKIMKYESQNVSELKDKISKINEYRNFQQKKNKVFLDLINFMKETNSKYKNDKSVNEQIDKLEKVFNDNYKTSVNTIDFYKEYLITGNEKYFAFYQQGYEKLQSGKDEITRLTTSIGNSL